VKGFISLVLILILSVSCKTLEYTDPTSGASLSYSSIFTSANDVQIVFTSPEKTVAVSIGSTQNDQIFEQISDIIKSYGVSGIIQ